MSAGRFGSWLCKNGQIFRIGLIRGRFYVLEVRGGKGGRKISLPVNLSGL